MEELRSTEILDREIQSDAQRKAEKVLNACEIECAQMREDVLLRIQTIRLQKEDEYAKRLALYEQDSNSVIPLEKQRRLVSFIDSTVQKALDLWFDSIGKEKRLVLYSNLLTRYRDILLERKLIVQYRGYSQSEIVKLINGIFGNEKIESISELSVSQAASANLSDGLFIETTDHSILCRSTLSEIREDLLSGKRQEMAEALLGGRLSE